MSQPPQLYFTRRGRVLLYVDTPAQTPVLTAENYTKWYELYVVLPTGVVQVVPVELVEQVMDKYPDARWVDHLYHPRLLHRLAHELHAALDERLLEVATGRWIFESGDSGFPVEQFNDPEI